MEGTNSEKEKLLFMLSEINGRLEELEKVMHSSFSDFRVNLHHKQASSINRSEEMIKRFEKELESHQGTERFTTDRIESKSAVDLKLGCLEKIS